VLYKKFEDEQALEEELPFVHYICQKLLYDCQQQIHGVLSNFPVRWLSRVLRIFIFPLGRHFSPPPDALGHTLARLLMQPSVTRSRLGKGAFLAVTDKTKLGQMEIALQKIIAVEPIERRVQEALKEGRLSGYRYEEHVVSAEKVGVITADEAQELLSANALRDEVIAVDSFEVL
jgi:acyl-CoA dehydrogenase